MLARSPADAPADPSCDSTSSSAPVPSIDDLDREIVHLAGRINAATYDLLVLIRRFDERAGWLGWAFPNCAEWLHWRCDISKSAAREKLRVAHALKTLPAIGRAFAAARPASPTCCCSARSTTRSCTRAVSGSRRITGIAGSSAGRTAARCRLAATGRRT